MILLRNNLNRKGRLKLIRNNKEVKKIVIKDKQGEVLAIITDCNVTRRGDVEVFIDGEMK